MEKDILQDLVDSWMETRDSVILGKIILQLKPFLKTRAEYIRKLTQTEYEDMMQELAIVVMGRLEKYNRSRGKFITYLFNSMRGDPTDTLQRLTKKKRGGDGKSQFLTLISLNSPIRPGDDGTLEDFVESPYGEIEETVLNHDVNEIKESKKNLYKYLHRRA